MCHIALSVPRILKMYFISHLLLWHFMGNKLIFRHPKQFARNAAIPRMIGILKKIKRKSVLGESSILKYLRKLFSCVFVTFVPNCVVVIMPGIQCLRSRSFSNTPLALFFPSKQLVLIHHKYGPHPSKHLCRGLFITELYSSINKSLVVNCRES